ncbi:related to multidrug efflux pump [Ramularia collo-cygni]|uniref:Related to multidrug efflux pump n=1 Tax=Ramularia collo-cygni TaxID=112498 RepID=A0A2D3UW59_9PEZI|nr:related to multidrug efflux pump [Ramularia collo-cygni]CZT18455.1 related to multidrug efflux pump [Ramularia collo-cygni]
MEAYFQYRRLQQSNQERIQRKDSQTDLESSESSDGEKASTSRFVEFEHCDPNDPRQWETRWKLFYTVIIWLLVFVTGWSSAADSTSHEVAARHWGVSEVAESLAASMYLFGVAFGAVVAGPCSETVGRLPTYLGTFAMFLIWTMASALAPTFGGQIVFRGLAGLFASASMSIYGGSLADMFETKTRALIWPFFALAPLLGPTIAPIVTGWLTQELGWRWDDWFTLIISGAAYLMAMAFLPETFQPIILSYKAQMLREMTGDATYRAEFDESTNLSQRLAENFRRIARFTFRESTTVLFGLYLTFLYLLIYGFLEGFDYIFTKTYTFNIGQRYTAFAAVAVGIGLGLPYVVVVNRFVTRRDQTRTKGNGPLPESRLIPAVFASPLLVIAMFWLGFTNRTDISYFSSLGACCLFGFTLMALFTPTYHYLLDTYGTVASSALAAITFMRYLASGGMVIATEPLYTALTVKWVLVLFGCIAAVLMPIPWIFWWFGARMRSKNPSYLG